MLTLIAATLVACSNETKDKPGTATVLPAYNTGGDNNKAKKKAEPVVTQSAVDYRPLFVAAEKNDAQSIQRFFTENPQANVNQQNEAGETAIEVAAASAADNAVSALLNRGAKPGNAWQLTVEGDHLEVLQVLIEQKAEISQTEKSRLLQLIAAAGPVKDADFVATDMVPTIVMANVRRKKINEKLFLLAQQESIDAVYMAYTELAQFDDKAPEAIIVNQYTAKGFAELIAEVGARATDRLQYGYANAVKPDNTKEQTEQSRKVQVETKEIKSVASMQGELYQAAARYYMFMRKHYRYSADVVFGHVSMSQAVHMVELEYAPGEELMRKLAAGTGTVVKEKKQQQQQQQQPDDKVQPAEESQKANPDLDPVSVADQAEIKPDAQPEE